MESFARTTIATPLHSYLLTTETGARIDAAYRAHLIPFYETHGVPIVANINSFVQDTAKPVVQKATEPVCQAVHPYTEKLLAAYDKYLASTVDTAAETTEQTIVPVLYSAGRVTRHAFNGYVVPATSCAVNDYLVPWFTNHVKPRWNQQIKPAIGRYTRIVVDYTKTSVLPAIVDGAVQGYRVAERFTTTYVVPYVKATTVRVYVWIKSYVFPPIRKQYDQYLKSHVDRAVPWDKVYLVTDKITEVCVGFIQETYFMLYAILTGEEHPVVMERLREQQAQVVAKEREQMAGQMREALKEGGEQVRGMARKLSGSVGQWMQAAKGWMASKEAVVSYESRMSKTVVEQWDQATSAADVVKSALSKAIETEDNGNEEEVKGHEVVETESPASEQTEVEERAERKVPADPEIPAEENVGGSTAAKDNGSPSVAVKEPVASVEKGEPVVIKTEEKEPAATAEDDETEKTPVVVEEEPPVEAKEKEPVVNKEELPKDKVPAIVVEEKPKAEEPVVVKEERKVADPSVKEEVSKTKTKEPVVVLEEEVSKTKEPPVVKEEQPKAQKPAIVLEEISKPEEPPAVKEEVSTAEESKIREPSVIKGEQPNTEEPVAKDEVTEVPPVVVDKKDGVKVEEPAVVVQKDEPFVVDFMDTTAVLEPTVVSEEEPTTIGPSQVIDAEPTSPSQPTEEQQPPPLPADAAASLVYEARDAMAGAVISDEKDKSLFEELVRSAPSKDQAKLENFPIVHDDIVSEEEEESTSSPSVISLGSEADDFAETTIMLGADRSTVDEDVRKVASNWVKDARKSISKELAEERTRQSPSSFSSMAEEDGSESTMTTAASEKEDIPSKLAKEEIKQPPIPSVPKASKSKPLGSKEPGKEEKPAVILEQKQEEPKQKKIVVDGKDGPRRVKKPKKRVVKRVTTAT